MTIRFASQTYSWQMSGDWHGRLDEIAKVVAENDFSGIEFEVVMADGFETADRVSALLAETGLELAAITLVLPWRESEESAAERAEADRVIGVLESFPGAKLALVQTPFDEAPADRERAQDNLLACLAAVAGRAQAHGVSPTFHPNSPDGSIVRNSADYARVLPRLAPGLGWTPDTGHLVLGGMDVLEMIRRYRDRVDHIHLKDADSSVGWVPNGTGIIDMAGAVQLLVDTGYEGWVVVEDESPQAERDPNHAAADNRDYVRRVLQPITEREAMQ